MNKYNTFIFESYDFDKYKKILKLRYSYDDDLLFEEIIEFPSNKNLNKEEMFVLDKTFKYLHLACGISYYKLFLPKNIKIKTFQLSRDEADFFNDFYFNGLGEFSYRNNIINLRNIINFPFNDNTYNKSSDLSLKKRYTIPIGGGKDSITTMEILKKHYNNLLLCSVGTAQAIENTVKISGLDYFKINRKISPNLFEFNNKIELIKYE